MVAKKRFASTRLKAPSYPGFRAANSAKEFSMNLAMYSKVSSLKRSLSRWVNDLASRMLLDRGSIEILDAFPGETNSSSSTQETLSLEADDHSIYLLPTMAFGGRDKKLSQEGAAEHMWELLIAPLQQSARF